MLTLEKLIIGSQKKNVHKPIKQSFDNQRKCFCLNEVRLDSLKCKRRKKE